ncbi:EAL domain-containing protein [Alkalibacillus aidingensis]|uniref:EAL domain-containing protein n=1 Tax=Alkalibacillus aidingensis TaxID=2747607 RepID=UPI001660457A|nr:EAL domain-containing protein [Alkalibacillus aidingensis]
MSIKSFITEEKFFHYFQPIYDLWHSQIIGYEVLLRSYEYPNPEHTFQEAKKEKQLYELDSRSIHKAVKTYQSEGSLGKDGNLFLNVFPSTILNPNFPSFLNQIINQSNLKSQQIVLEILESESISDFNSFKAQICNLKSSGYLIAIDDFGNGSSDFRSVIEIEPNYLKLDRYFAQDLHQSKQKQSIIKFMDRYCKEYDCQLILEGIETTEEIAMAKELQIPIGQGYILGRPGLLKEIV